MFGRLTNFFRNLLRLSPAHFEIRDDPGIIHIETEADLLEHFDQPRELEINNGIIRLDDGTTIEVPEYDHNAVRDRYFAELVHPRTNRPYPNFVGVTEEQILAWINEKGQEIDSDHLPYDPKYGF